MGNATSSPDDGTTKSTDDNSLFKNDDEYDDPFEGIETLGYRVLGVQPNSPASAAGLVSFLDFLVGADNKMLLGSGEGLEPGEEYDDVDLPNLLEEKKGSTIELLVWNIKSQAARLVDIIPSDTWGGAGLLGVTIRLDNYAGAEDRLVRVLSIESPKSPAAVAGFVPGKDFILGTTHQTLDSVDQLALVLQQCEDEVVELYVYNTDEDRVRVVALLPTTRWEGSRGGLLGAEVGTGYLHRLPFSSRGTSGSSVERKVRYVDSIVKSETSVNREAAELIDGKGKGTQKVLALEPQLEMEPGSDELHEETDNVLHTPKASTDNVLTDNEPHLVDSN